MPLPSIANVKTNGDLVHALNNHVRIINDGNTRFALLREYYVECLKMQQKLKE